MEPYDDVELPPDFNDTERVGVRSPDVSATSHGRVSEATAVLAACDWREGGTSWTQDYPRADRHFARALRRLCRIHRRGRWNSPSTWMMAMMPLIIPG